MVKATHQKVGMQAQGLVNKGWIDDTQAESCLVNLSVGSGTRTWMFVLISKRSVVALDRVKSYMWLHAHAPNVRVDLERASRCLGRDEELDVSTGWWSDRFVLMAVTRHERSNSQLASGLAGSRNFTIEAGCHLSFRWVELLDHWLWCSVCPSLILCRLAGSDPM
jgi:hypothetical protein